MAAPEDAPVWLSDEPEIEALLHAALDRFDRQPAEERERDVFLPAERFLSTLSRSDAAADQLWKLVGEIERRGILKVRRGKRGPYDPDWKGAKLAFPAAGESTLRNWLRRERTTPELVRWRDAVNASAQAFPGGCEALLARRFVIEGRSPEDVVAAFARMGTVTGPITLRQLSALCFWGDSKVLDERGELVSALFPQLVVRERAIVVAVYLPQHCEGVLFVENQDTYTAACGGFPPEVAHLALVFASGFRSSAQRVRSPGGAVLHYAGPGASAGAHVGAGAAVGGDAGTHTPPGVGAAAALAGSEHGGLRGEFERWWFEQGAAPGRCWFWGDLDFAGMQILKSLRSRFGAVSAWQPGYAPMLMALRAEGGYSTAGLQGRGQVDPVLTGCAYADDVLLPAIRERGQLDQERPITR